MRGKEVSNSTQKNRGTPGKQYSVMQSRKEKKKLKERVGFRISPRKRKSNRTVRDQKNKRNKNYDTKEKRRYENYPGQKGKGG